MIFCHYSHNLFSFQDKELSELAKDIINEFDSGGYSALYIVSLTLKYNHDFRWLINICCIFRCKYKNISMLMF